MYRSATTRRRFPPNTVYEENFDILKRRLRQSLTNDCDQSYLKALFRWVSCASGSLTVAKSLCFTANLCAARFLFIFAGDLYLRCIEKNYIFDERYFLVRFSRFLWRVQCVGRKSIFVFAPLFLLRWWVTCENIDRSETWSK